MLSLVKLSCSYLLSHISYLTKDMSDVKMISPSPGDVCCQVNLVWSFYSHFKIDTLSRYLCYSSPPRLDFFAPIYFLKLHKCLCLILWFDFSVQLKRFLNQRRHKSLHPFSRMLSVLLSLCVCLSSNSHLIYLLILYLTEIVDSNSSPDFPFLFAL